MSNRHSGSCLCGQVRFEIDGEFERTTHLRRQPSRLGPTVAR